MRNFNVAVLEGRLVADPELRYVQNGNALCKFSIASNYSYYKGDNLQEEVSFFDVATWSKLAEQCNEYLKKGRRVLVNGRLKQSKWQDDGGGSHSKIEVIGNQVQFLDLKKDDEGSGNPDLSEETPF